MVSVRSFYSHPGKPPTVSASQSPTSAAGYAPSNAPSYATAAKPASPGRGSTNNRAVSIVSNTR